jgi:xanthine dehydrogenase large subunit
MSIGKNIKHDSSFGHVTGTSIFIDDRAPLRGEIHVGVVGTPVAAGKLKKVHYQEALELSGVLAIYTAKDLSHNAWGAIFKTQPLLVENEIGHLDEPAVVIAAENKDVLLKAKKLIQMDIEEGNPLFSIDESIQKERYVYKATPLVKGDVEKALKDSPRTIKGNFECGGQEHFYLESQASIVYPLENGQLEVHSSSQHPTETQHLVAHAVGLPFHQVTCIVKRMGGAFGGKESQAAPFAAYAALCAYKLQRPARIILTKDEDMAMTGKRHPFKNFYEIGFDDEGKILALKADLYSDAGPYADLSSAILERAMFHIDSAYFIPHAKITGTCCKTNYPSNTAFRGFGGPQGTLTIESIIEDIAFETGKDPAEIRKINLYGKGERNVTHYGQIIDHNPLPEIFNDLFNKTEYKTKRKDIDHFNKQNKGKIRGLALSFTKFGIAFTAKFLNQGNALINVHLDGTIQFSTGATEMGQGVNTKIQQIIAHAFGLPPESIQAMPTSTEKNHNTSPTAASSGSDINGGAALKACEQIKDRLRIILHKHWSGEISDGVKELELEDCGDLSHILFEDQMVVDSKTNKKMTLNEALNLAYMNRVSLGAYAHFKTEGIGFDKEKSVGKPFNYFTNGAAVCEVEIDEYTGELKVLSTDILMDLGRPINPGIDQGQVTGAFIQGMGWVTQERLYFSNKGKLLSHSPTTYKIPNIQDTPRNFSVNFIENNNNHQCVHRSKAVGEPPFLLGICVFLAIKNALSYRSKGKVNIKAPATNERILEELYKES